MQNLRQTLNLKSAANTTNNNSITNSSSSSAETNNNATSPRRGIKIRSPRPVVTMSAPIITQSSIQTAPLISTVTPAALVVAKPLEPSHTLTLSNQATNIQPILPAVNNMRFILIFTNTNQKTFYNVAFYNVALI